MDIEIKSTETFITKIRGVASAWDERTTPWFRGEPLVEDLLCYQVYIDLYPVVKDMMKTGLCSLFGGWLLLSQITEHQTNLQ